MKVPFLFLGVAIIALIGSLAGTYGLLKLATFQNEPVQIQPYKKGAQIILPNGQGDFFASPPIILGNGTITFTDDKGQTVTVSGSFTVVGN